MLPALKVYQIDYEFIISNYLDRNLWKKVWNLFVYRDNVFTLNIYDIDTKNDRIRFEIRHNKISYSYEVISYDLKNTSIKILKQQINGAIFRTMETYDRDLARESDGYKRIQELYENEDDMLREVAEEYLDENNITLGDVREAYIDRYVCNNRKADTMKSNYLWGTRYSYCTDMLLVFTKAIGDTTRYQNIVNIVGNTTVTTILQELKEFEEYMQTEEYVDELHDALEAI